MIRLVLAVCIAVVSGCTDRESYTSRVEGIPLLLGEFQSYSSEPQVRARLMVVPRRERGSLPPGDSRQPFDIVTLTVDEYEHLGVAGELRLELFNDRLMDV